MPRMKVTNVAGWGDDGISVSYTLADPKEGYVVNLTEMATPKDAKAFKRLRETHIHDEFDISTKP